MPEQYVRDMEEDAQGYLPAVWNKMAEQGWMGLIVPDSYGGVGMGYLDLIVLIEEFGRELTPGPFPRTASRRSPCSRPRAMSRSSRTCPRSPAGTQVWALAHTEPSARFDAEGVELTATKDGDDYVLNGTKLFVRDSHVADKMVVTARSGRRHLAVRRRREGGRRDAPPARDDRLRQAERGHVRERARARPATSSARRARPGRSSSASVRRRRCSSAPTSSACSQMAFDITLNYTKERVQFGRPIASFQAMQHKAADMVTDVDASRYITYQAAWAVDDRRGRRGRDRPHGQGLGQRGQPPRRRAGQQMHGGIGFTKDYKIQLYFRRQKAAELAWGDADYHRELVGQALGMLIV